MKTIQKSLLAFLFVLIMSASYTAQAQSTISLGPKAGLNLANFRGDDAKDNKNRTAFNAGLVLNYSITESAGLGFELDYSSQGAKYEVGKTESQTKVDYVRTTLLFNYFFGEGSLRPKLFVGPYAGFLTSAKAKSGDSDWVDVDKDGLNATDFGAALGAGIHFSISEGIWLTPDVRYNYGFTNVPANDDIKYVNGVLSVNLGLTFPLN